ncbi:MAG: hypothetical protein AB7K68_02110 [Bacteriovoracia bacterium]
MKFLSWLLTFSLFLSSASGAIAAAAKPESSGLYEVASAYNTNKTLGEVLSKIYFLTKADFQFLEKELGKDYARQPLPKAQLINGALVFNTEQGRVTLQPASATDPFLFKVNGKEWRFVPSLGLADNVKELNRLTTARESFSFIPSAQAVIPVVIGVALWVAASGVIYYGCNQALPYEKGDSTLKRAAVQAGCIAGAVAIPPLLPVYAFVGFMFWFTGPEKGFIPTGLKCADENGGKLEVTGRSVDGVSQVFTVEPAEKGHKLVVTDLDKKGRTKDRRESLLSEDFKILGDPKLAGKEAVMASSFTAYCADPKKRKRMKELTAHNSERLAKEATWNPSEDKTEKEDPSSTAAP